MVWDYFNEHVKGFLQGFSFLEWYVDWFMMTSVNSLALLMVVPGRKSTFPAHVLPKEAEEMSAWKYVLENLFQGDPFVVFRK